MKQIPIIAIALLGLTSCGKNKCNCEIVGESNLYSNSYEEVRRSYYGDDCSEDGDILATQSQVWYDDFGTRRVGTTRVRVECK
jgi:hypothetical protein